MKDLINVLKKVIDIKSDSLLNEYERDLSYAKKLQRSLIIDEFPETDIYQFYGEYLPAETLGGDLFDVKVIDDNYVAFYIADVAGHGIPAAMLTFFVKQSIEMSSIILRKRIVNSPKQVIEKLNKKMIEADFEGSPHVTIFYAVLDLTSLTLTYSSAGHHPAVLLRKNIEEPILIGKTSKPVGWIKDLNVYEDNVELKEDDKVILFTDGLLEVTKINKNDYDIAYKKFGEILNQNRNLNIEKLIKNIIKGVIEKEEPRDDDIAILGLEIKKFELKELEI